MLIIGIDLAWGDRKSDGVCFLEAGHRDAAVSGYAYPRGDDELLRELSPRVSASAEVLVTIDAPLVLPNVTGTRPVDRLTHRLFHREHAACHPANLTKCPRPPRVLERLSRLGIQPGWEVHKGMKTAAEVYPHPAMIRMFRLPRIIKYKKGSVEARRKEFRRLQRCIRKSLRELFPALKLDRETTKLLKAPWNKPTEDRVDSLFCALIGLWHWKHRGKRSEVIGNLETGFILLPEDLRSETAVQSGKQGGKKA
ncbi:MAG: DUF429 domain-containing protein [Ignavibacteriales bacterium]|nr:DUF429 domain-containing protein [Ignavibacteriales bacterium]